MKSKNFGNNLKGQVQVCSKCGRYHWGECWKDRTEVINDHFNEVGHVKRNYSRLRIEAVALREGPVGGKVRPTRNARPEDNKPGNPENKVRNENN